MKKLLFIAGEPGGGKSEHIAKPLSASGLGLILHTDKISLHAAKHYEHGNSLGCKWQLWKHEFDRTDNHLELKAAFFRSIQERDGPRINRQRNLICEGVLSDHPVFRQIIQAILPRFGFTSDDALTLAICIPWEQLQQNLEKRGRPEDQDSDFVKTRSVDYQKRLGEQVDIQCFATTDAVCQAATGFLNLEQ